MSNQLYSYSNIPPLSEQYPILSQTLSVAYFSQLQYTLFALNPARPFLS